LTPGDSSSRGSGKSKCTADEAKKKNVKVRRGGEEGEELWIQWKIYNMERKWESPCPSGKKLTGRRFSLRKSNKPGKHVCLHEKKKGEEEVQNRIEKCPGYR